MNFKKTSHHVQSIIIAGIIVVVLLAIGILVYNYWRQQKIICCFEPVEITRSDQAATIAQNFIRSLASYDQQQNKPILLKETESVDKGLWLVRFEVEQKYLGVLQTYLYTVEIRDGRVTNYNSSVADVERQIFIYTPFASEVMASQKISVKGQISNELGAQESRVMIKITDPKTEAVVASYSLSVDEADEYTYLREILKPTGLAGEVLLTVSAGDYSVVIPFVVAGE